MLGVKKWPENGEWVVRCETEQVLRKSSTNFQWDSFLVLDIFQNHMNKHHNNWVQKNKQNTHITSIQIIQIN